MSNFQDVYKIQPRSVRGVDNIQVMKYFQRLSRLIMSNFEFTGLPDEMSREIVRSVFIYSPLVIVNTKTQGIYCLPCSTYGQNINYEPTDFVIANPTLKFTKGKINKDGVILSIDQFCGTYFTCYDMIIDTAVSLASIDASFQITVMNSRASMVFRAKNRAERKSLEYMYDKITAGNPAVFMQKSATDSNDNSWSQFVNVKNSYVGRELLESKRSVINEFLTYAGINNANTDKRERLNQDEVNANNGEVESNAVFWRDNLNRCFEKANELFGTNMHCELKQKGVNQSEFNKLMEPAQ